MNKHVAIFRMKLILHFLICLFFFHVGIQAQPVHKLIIEASDSSQKKEVADLLRKINFEPVVSNPEKETTDRKLNDVLFNLYDRGYLAARFDSLKSDSLSSIAYLQPGNVYRWASVRKGNIDEELLSQSGFKEKHFKETPLYYKDLVRFEERIIEACENTGYPFATIKLDSLELKEINVSGALNLDRGNFYRIDSILFKGTADITEIYLRNYLGIKPGDVYNEELIRQISTRISELPFLEQMQPPELEFSEKGCKIYLYLARRKASQINGIVGVLPDDVKPGKVLVTGEVQLKLNNSFGSGETMDVAWKSPAPKTQDLKTRLVYPFIVSRFGLDLGFGIYKKDSTYLEVSKEGGVQYLLPRGNYLKAFVNNRNTTLQSDKGLEFLTVLPPFADVSSTLYGIGLRSEKLDYRLNPRKGFMLETTAAAGERVITKHPKINPVLYDSLELRSAQYSGHYTFDLFIPLQGRTVLNLGAKGAHLISESYFQNELFRIGGLKTLRGFDEEGILASSYDILKIEWRYLLEKNSYFALFWNGAYYENRSLTTITDRYDTPYGFGAGVTFDTRLGIFSVNYALGKQFDNPILIRSGKISFGLLNNF